jgi:hypothetical protein
MRSAANIILFFLVLLTPVLVCDLDDQKRVLSVATLSKEKYVFDFTTGELVSARRPLRGIAIAGGVILALMAVWGVTRRKMMPKPTGQAST